MPELATDALEYVVRQPSGNGSRGALVFLHSRGANMRTFTGLAGTLGDYTYLFPNAPFVSGEVAQGAESRRTWLGPHEEELLGAASVSRHLLKRFLANVPDLVGKRGPLVLAGFSQGAACALRLGLEQPEGIRAIVALSGYTMKPVPCGTDRGPAIFVGHGSSDTVMPIAVGRRVYQRLVAGGWTVTYREYPIEHEVSLAEARDVRAWLDAIGD